ncbi:MFS transporter [Streptomyces sp. NPDC059009]|uniref:MFS transporter n=1 Tax=Streptomyces sp. NPDC059009 TaxID=3346694 RepID=UPI0036ABDDE1
MSTDTTTATASASGQAAPARLSTKVMWAILGVVLAADAMDLLDSTLTNIAAPTIVKDIGGGEGLIKWLGSSYALAMGVLLVLGGRLGDKFGQRRVFLVGLAGFTLASAACGLAADPGMIVVARLFQGSFGALMIPQGIAIMTRHFDRDMMRKAFSIFGPLLGVATVGGPVLGGFLVDAAGWRFMFLINIVLGAAALVAAVRILPRGRGERSTVIDGIGSGLLALTMGTLMFGLIEGSTDGWGVLPVGCLVVGAVAFGLFCLRQRTAADPLLRPTLLKNRGFTSGLIMGLAYFAVVSGLMYVISLFLQEGMGRTPTGAALSLSPIAVGIIISAFAVRPLMPRLGRGLILAGLVLTLLGGAWTLGLVLAYGTGLNVWALVPATLLIGLGMGSCFGTLFDIALGDVSAEEAGSASGSLSAIQQLASAIGSAVMTTVFFHTLGGGQAHAMTVSLIVMLAVTTGCLALVRLLPKAAQPEGAHAA